MIVTEARSIYNELADHNIRDLVYSYPADHKIEHDQPYWNGAKRYPKPEPLSIDDPMHVGFIHACSNIILANLGEPMINRDTVFNWLSGLPPTEEYVAQRIVVLTPEEEKALKDDPFAEKPKAGKDSHGD